MGRSQLFQCVLPHVIIFIFQIFFSHTQRKKDQIMNDYEFRKRKPIRGFRFRGSRRVTPLKCTLYVQMEPLWKLMRAMGLLPYVEVPKTGDVDFRWRSISMLYSAIYFSYVFVVLTFVSKQKIEDHATNEDNFKYLVNNLLSIVTQVPTFFTPFIFWRSTKKFVNYIRSWAEFETNYNQITGQTLDIKIKKYCAAVLVLVVLYLAITRYLSSSDETGPLAFQVVFIHILLSSYLLLPYVAFITHIFISASNSLQKNLEKDGLSIKSGGEMIQEYRCLWLKLVNIIRKVLTTFFLVAIEYSFKFILATTFCVYVMIKNLRQNGFDSQTMSYLSVAAVVFCILYFMALRFQMAHDSILKCFIKGFFKNRRSLRFYQGSAVDEIKIFTKMFRIVNAEISCNGYFVVNQSTLVSLLSLIATYLLIIFQFRNTSQPASSDPSNKSAT